MALPIVPGQVIRTGLIPYPDGSPIQYASRPYLVVGISATHVETLIISSLYGKAHKLAYKSNFELKCSVPPLPKPSFVKLDSHQTTELALLTDLRVISNGMLIDATELRDILSLYKNYLPQTP